MSMTHLDLGRLEGGDGTGEGGSDAGHFVCLLDVKKKSVCVQEWRFPWPTGCFWPCFFRGVLAILTKIFTPAPPMRKMFSGRRNIGGCLQRSQTLDE